MLKKIISNMKKIIFEGGEKQFDYASYSNMLGLNRELKFSLIKEKVSSEEEFNSVTNAAQKVLEEDLKRFGEDFDQIEASHANRMMGTIASMTIIADGDGKLSVRFHKRDENGLWNGETKKFPEKGKSNKYKYEVFFLLSDDSEED